MEAADEIARQLRLRDLAGLIVIDFIDMDEKRNNRSVERRLKECLKQDRARIQVGRISHFGLLEMSRQRIRTSVLESSTEKCPYCGGSGHVRSVSSLALQVLRALEEQLMRGATHNLIARTRPDVALYVLNQKRAHLRGLEERFAITITVVADETMLRAQAFAIDRGEQVHTVEAARALAEQDRTAVAAPLEDEDDLGKPTPSKRGARTAEDEDDGRARRSHAEPAEATPRRRRRRRRRGGRDGARRRRGAAARGRRIRARGRARGPAEDDFARGRRRGRRAKLGAAGEAMPADPNPARRRTAPQRRRGRRGGRRNRHERDGMRRGTHDRN